MKNAFYLMLKDLFVLEIFEYLFIFSNVLKLLTAIDMFRLCFEV